MKKQLDVKLRDCSYYSTITIDLPNTCPHCGDKITPHIWGGYSEQAKGESISNVSVLAQCINEKCLKYFALHYIKNSKTNYQYALYPYTYRPPINVSLPENISKISANFVEIYSQAVKAESEKLDQIAGVGYRKSLEFLIKDFAIYKNPDSSDSIKSMFLGNVINDYYTDLPKIQTLAKASAWIGNDETHYVRRHTDKDIEDLKRFILAASQFIAAEYDADQALKFIES